MRGRSIHDLNRDFLDAVAQADAFDLDPELRARLDAYRQFIESNAHRLGPHPGTLREVALAEAEDSLIRKDVLAGLAQWKPRRPWFRRLHCPETHRNPALLRTIPVGSQVNSVALLERDGGRHALARIAHRAPIASANILLTDIGRAVPPAGRSVSCAKALAQLFGAAFSPTRAHR